MKRLRLRPTEGEDERGLEYMVRARVDAELYAWLLQDVRRQKSTLSQVLRGIVLKHYRPEESPLPANGTPD